MIAWKLLPKKGFQKTLTENTDSTMDATKKKELFSQCNEKLVKARLVELS